MHVLPLPMHICACKSLPCPSNLLPFFFFKHISQSHGWQLVNCGSELASEIHGLPCIFFSIYILVTLKKLVMAGPITLHPARKSPWASAPWVGTVLKDPCFPQLGLGSVCLEPPGEERRKARDLPRQSEAWPCSLGSPDAVESDLAGSRCAVTFPR